MYEHILVPTDGSTVAATAVDHAIDLAEKTELREDAEEATGYVRRRAEAAGLDAVERHAGGRPHDVIADYARSNDIDLIVMGSHGRSGVRRALLGSVTERTLRSTHVPVFVVDYADAEP